MKKIFSAILAALMLLSAFSVMCTAADTVELKITSEKVYAGDEFYLNLFISDNSQMSGAVIDLLYDSDKLEYVSAEPGAILDSNANISIRNIDGKNPSVRFTYLAPSSSVTSAGVILTVKFKALSNASGKTEIKISIPNAGDFVTFELENISYTAVNSTVEIISAGSMGSTEEIPSKEAVSEDPTESQSVEETGSDTETSKQTEITDVSSELPTQNNESVKTGSVISWVSVAIFAVVAIIAAAVVFVILKSRKNK